MNTEKELTEQAFIAGYDRMAQQVHQTHKDKGFAAQAQPDNLLWMGNQIALMHGELSEAHESIRKGTNDDKITRRKGYEVELADVVIRVMNFGTDCGLDIASALVEKARFNESREFMHGGKKF